MKTIKNHLDLMKSQSGSMVMQVLIVAVVLTIISGTVMGYLSRQSVHVTYLRTREEADNLVAMISMALSNDNACSLNMPSFQKGNNRDFPLRLGQDIVLTPGQNYGLVYIKSTYFDDNSVHQIPNASWLGETGFVGDLIVEIGDPNNKNAPALRIAKVTMYLINTFGKWDRCFATAWADPQPRYANGYRMTVDDVMCTELRSSLERQQSGNVGTVDPSAPAQPPVWIYFPGVDGNCIRKTAVGP